MASVLALAPVLVSLVSMLTQPSDSSLSIRVVEWMRDNGARGLVNRVENFYYSVNAPATGGPALEALPHQVGSALRSGDHRIHFYRPARLRPDIHPALPGEGVWRATFAGGGSRPPALVTQFRPQPLYPHLVAGVAWLDHTRTSTWLYPGLQEPAVQMRSRGPEQVPKELRGKLLATFNSGFKLTDSGGGFATGGHTYAPLKRGLATIVRYRDGRIDITSWNGGPSAGPDLSYARQNLPLIASRGEPNPNLADGPQWGATLGNAVAVWRSGVGIDRRGNLIHAAAPQLTLGSLARS
jgi:hypothetical protein